MDKYRKEISSTIHTLSKKGKILFGGLTSEMLYPNYVEFTNKTGWGDRRILQDGISLIFQCVIDENLFSIDEIEAMITRLDLVTPDTGDFPGILTSFALDACTSVYSTLQFIIDDNEENILDVATYARDTVDMYIQEKEDMNTLDPSIDIQIENDEFMINEKSRQKLLIEYLKELDLEVVSDDLLSNLKSKTPIIDLSLLR